MITPPEEKCFRHGSSLALFQKVEDMRKHWDSLWMGGSIKAFLEKGSSGRLGELEHPFIHYLPKEGVILEAGCGTGQYVAALRARGFNVEGIDYAPETIRTIKAIDPTLKVRQGDIFSIDRPDGYYSGYVSIGVLEHNFAGPMAGLGEAHRVLRAGGIAVITVPQLNSARRRLWTRLGEAPGPTTGDGLSFYQDHLDPAVFQRQLAEAGFEVLEAYPYELFGGLIRDWPIGRYLRSKEFFHWRLRKLVKRLCEKTPRGLKLRQSHMLAFVCRRK
jgi:SAM-dependent methyltransferase